MVIRLLTMATKYMTLVTSLATDSHMANVAIMVINYGYKYVSQ